MLLDENDEEILPHSMWYPTEIRKRQGVNAFTLEKYNLLGQTWATNAVPETFVF